jgi:pimeloyl-ACP methyl ester carboxylesterase
MFNALMVALGYDRYFAQGGDWGSIVTSRMAQDFADHVAALHVNMAPGGPPNPMLPVDGLNAEDQARLDKFRAHQMVDSAYAMMQTTRPQTLAVAMNDSPAGLAAWILDKFWAWTDHGGDPGNVFDDDHLLDNLSVYWFTGTAGSSFRLYHESLFRVEYRHSVVAVPTGVARFAGEPFTWPRSLVEWNYTNIQDWQELPVGGHFAAFQRKDDFLRVVRNFLRTQSV